jgi:hypothetical protein
MHVEEAFQAVKSVQNLKSTFKKVKKKFPIAHQNLMSLVGPYQVLIQNFVTEFGANGAIILLLQLLVKGQQIRLRRYLSSVLPHAPLTKLKTHSNSARNSFKQIGFLCYWPLHLLGDNPPWRSA